MASASDHSVCLGVFQATSPTAARPPRQQLDLIPVERVFRRANAGPATDLVLTSFDLVTSPGSSPAELSEHATQQLHAHNKGR